MDRDTGQTLSAARPDGALQAGRRNLWAGGHRSFTGQRLPGRKAGQRICRRGVLLALTCEAERTPLPPGGWIAATALAWVWRVRRLRSTRARAEGPRRRDVARHGPSGRADTARFRGQRRADRKARQRAGDRGSPMLPGQEVRHHLPARQHPAEGTHPQGGQAACRGRVCRALRGAGLSHVPGHPWPMARRGRFVLAPGRPGQ